MRLFISYSHQDRSIVEDVVALLRKGGHEPWFDEKLVAGQDWKHKLEQEIGQSDAIVFMASPRSVQSEWCMWELSTATENSKPIVPVLLEKTDLPPSLSKLHYADFTSENKTNAAYTLMGGLSEIMQCLPRETAQAKPANPKGLPAQAVEIRQEITVGDVSGGHITVIGQQNTLNPRTLAIIIILILALLVFAGVALFPEAPRQELLYQLGIVPPSPLPTFTPEPTLTPTPPLARYDFGIAVAGFYVPDSEHIDVTDVDELIEGMCLQLQSELDEYSNRMRRTFGVVSPSVVGRIEGATRQEREEAAAQMALRVHADIVVYGVAQWNDSSGEIHIQPEFYVSPTKFSDALEITGSQRLGSRIAVVDSLQAQPIQLRDALELRTSAIANIVAGITEYQSSSYDTALGYFEQVRSEDRWDQVEGNEVLNILLGNTYLKIAQTAALTCQPETSDSQRAEIREALEQARQEYETAAAIAPDYSRPYAGLASVTALAALWEPLSEGCDPYAGDPELLEEAFAYVERAEQSIEQPTEIAVQAKLLYTRAQINLFRWYNQETLTEDALYLDIQNTAQRIILNYDDGNYPALAPLAIEAYALRGMTDMLLGNYRPAIGEFGLALEIPGIPAIRRMFFTGWMGDCYKEIGQLQEAAQHFDAAYQLAEQVGNHSDAEYYAQERDRIDELLGTG